MATVEVGKEMADVKDIKQIEVVAAIIHKGDKIFATRRGYGDLATSKGEKCQ